MIAKGLIIYIIVVLVAIVIRVAYLKWRDSNDCKNRKQIHRL